jgi:hypothetical protein
LYINAFEIAENDELDATIGKKEEERATKQDKTFEVPLEDWEVEITNANDEAALNKTLRELQLNPPKNDNWKRILNDKAKFIGSTYDKRMKRFVQLTNLN